MFPFLSERKEKRNPKERFEYLYVEEYVPEVIEEKKDSTPQEKTDRGVAIIQLW